jgi:LacI family transcriptional regulator
VRHLYDLGHRTIAWVGSIGAPQITARADGVRSAVQELGMEIIEVTTVPRILTGPGRLAADELHERGIPSAVICANDMLALGMEMRLLGLGYHIPEDVSIIGFDDIEFAAAAMVPLTSVARPAFAMGASAIDLLLEGCGTVGHEHQQVVFNAELSVRSSTGPARADTWSGPAGRAHI